MERYDYTYAERQEMMRYRRKKAGLKEVREWVAPEFVSVLKSIANEMRDPDKSEKWRKIFPVSKGSNGTE